MFVNQIIESTNGILVNGSNLEISDFSIDSRTIKKDDLFISIKGDKFDGNDFIEEVLKKDAIGVIYQGKINKTLIDKYKDKIFINVDDTIKALQDMAKFKRSLYDIPVVAITGSVGKTSTKDIISSVMSKKYNVLSTIGNFNNHIGLPLTLLKLKDHNAMCIEMGMNHFGELKILTNILKPTIAVITNIGTAHIGNLGSRENILKAKLEILEGLTTKNVIINNDNDLLNKWNKENNKYNVITYGINNESIFIANNINLDINKSSYDVIIDNKKYTININVPGEHFIYNSLCALSVGKLLDIDNEDIIDGILKFKLSSKRMEEKKINNVTLLIDCYNANYDSMKYAIKVLGKYNTRKIAVLGDMLELGEYTSKLHSDLGSVIDKNNIDVLVCVGNYSKYIYDNSNIKNKYMCKNNNEAIKLINEIKKDNDIILFKASNSMNFIEIVNSIK